MFLCKQQWTRREIKNHISIWKNIYTKKQNPFFVVSYRATGQVYGSFLKILTQSYMQCCRKLNICRNPNGRCLCTSSHVSHTSASFLIVGSMFVCIRSIACNMSFMHWQCMCVCVCVWERRDYWFCALVCESDDNKKYTLGDRYM